LLCERSARRFDDRQIDQLSLKAHGAAVRPGEGVEHRTRPKRLFFARSEPRSTLGT